MLTGVAARLADWVIAQSSESMQWFLHTTMSTFSIIVTFIYWAVEYPIAHHRLSPFNIDMHVSNEVQVMLDLGLPTTPIHLAHYLPLLLVSSVYVLFCVVYWLVGFTNLDEKPYVYKVLDFGGHPALASLCVLAFYFICLPLFYFWFWNAYLLRQHLAERLNAAVWCSTEKGGGGRLGDSMLNFLRHFSANQPQYSAARREAPLVARPSPCL